MPRTIHLNGAAPDDESVVFVTLFDKRYRLRMLTRSVQKGIETLERELNELERSPDSTVDDVMAKMAEGLDAILAIEGNHRTPASKVIMAKWNADELTPGQIQAYYEQLTEAASGARPT